MDNIQKLDIVGIELNSGTLHRSWLNHSIGTGDNRANRFGMRVFRDGQPVSLSGASVQGYFKNSQGTNIAISSGTISGNMAYVTLPQACYNYEGIFTLAIKVIGDGVTETMRIVDGMVDNTNSGSAVAPTGTVPTYQEVLAVYDQMVEAKNYAKNIKTALSYSGEDLLGNRIYLVSNQGEYFDAYGEGGNYYIDISSPGKNDDWDSYVISCRQNDLFTVYADGGTTALAWAFIDNTGLIKSRSSSSETVEGIEITAPAGSKYLVVNDKSGTSRVYNGVLHKKTLQNKFDDIYNEINLNNKNHVFYIAGGGNVAWSQYSESPVRLELGNNNFVLVANNNYYEILINDILSAATSAGLTVDQTNKTITGPTYVLYFDINANKPKIVIGITSPNGRAAISNNPVIFAAHYTSCRAGLVVNYMHEKRIRAVEVDNSKNANDIAELTEKIKYKKQNCVLYVANRGNVTWSQTDISPTTLNIGTNTLVFIVNDMSYEITASQILTAASNAGLTVIGNTITGVSFLIYFDLDAETVKAVVGVGSANGRRFISRYPAIFVTHYASYRDGLLVDAMAKRRIETAEVNIDKNTSDIEALQTGAESPIPDYYMDHIREKREAVLKNMLEIGIDGETFIFITDIHWETNEKHSPSLVHYLLNNLNINNLICGGDLINEGSKNMMIEAMRECITAFQHRNIYMPCAYGNHDNNANGTQATEHFSVAEQYALMQKQAEKQIKYFSNVDNANQNWNFFYDIENTKTRFVVLDVGNNGVYNRFNYFVQCLLSTPEGYNIIVIAHWLMQNGNISETSRGIEAICDAVNAKRSVTIAGKGTFDMSGAKSKVKMILAGHAHYDYNWFSEEGIPVIVIDCDNGPRSNGTDMPYARGTVTEQSFGVFSANYTEGVIKEIKIGRGYNAVFHLGTNAVGRGSTISLATELTNPTWETRETAIATVSNGTVTGTGTGKTIITAIGTDTKEYWFISVV